MGPRLTNPHLTRTVAGRQGLRAGNATGEPRK